MTGTSVVTVPGERDESIPPTPARQGILQALPSALGLVLTLGTLVAITWHAGQSLTNGDTYFHLRFGHEFLTGHWSLSHPGSVTSFGTNDWVPTQWLPQIAMAQAEDWFGLPGVAWLQGLLHLALAVTLWVIARRHAGPFVAAMILILGLFAASPGLSMRPQVISYLLVAVTTAAWMSSRADGRARWWLVPLTWVWAMCHGMWPVGIIIGLVAVAGIALDRGLPRRDLLKLAAVPVASAVAAALTPVGPALYPAVLLVGSRGQYFAEWQPPDFTRPANVALLVLLGTAVGPDAAPAIRVLVDRDPAGRAGRGLGGLLDPDHRGGRDDAGAADSQRPGRADARGAPAAPRDTRGGARAPSSVWSRSRSPSPVPSTTLRRTRRGPPPSTTCPQGPRCSTTGAAAATSCGAGRSWTW